MDDRGDTELIEGSKGLQKQKIKQKLDYDFFNATIQPITGIIKPKNRNFINSKN